MGALNRLLWRSGARCVSAVLSSPEILSESERALNISMGHLEGVDDEEEKRQKHFQTAIYCSSIAADILDFINSGLDLTFAVRLFHLKDSMVYAAVLLTGVILGRLAIVRGSYLLFKNGIQWSPLPASARKPPSSRVMNLLHCLFFTEAAVFLFEDFPCLVIYSHWMMINFPPEPLERLDDVNVAITVVSLALVALLLIVTILWAFTRVDPREWKTLGAKIFNSLHILTMLTLCGLLIRFVMITFVEAFDFTLRNDKKMPDHKLLGIEICEPETHDTRDEYCDEKSFLIRVAFAWATALFLSYYLVFRAAPVDEPVVAATAVKQLKPRTIPKGSPDPADAQDPTTSSSSGADVLVALPEPSKDLQQTEPSEDINVSTTFA